MAYKSRYESQISSALNQLTNREKFKYDFNADPLYHMYKDQYVKLGNDAAANAAATVAGLTGGYGSSYATTAASQANQEYLTKLNDIVPQLYNQALNAYMAEGDRLNSVYSTLSDAEASDYGKYRDTVADEQWQKNFDYQAARDKVADSQWQANYDQAVRQFEESIRQYNTNMAYQQARDQVTDSQWQQSFDATRAAQAAALSSARSGGSYVAPTSPAKADPTRYSYDINKISNSQWNNLKTIYKNSGGTESAITSTISQIYNINDAINSYIAQGYTAEEAQNYAKEDFDNVWQQVVSRLRSLTK